MDSRPHPGSSDPGRDVGRLDRRRIHDHDGRIDAGVADRLSAAARDAMPHITVTADTRTMASQPAEQIYGAVGLSNAPNVNSRTGIKTPDAVVASLESW